MMEIPATICEQEGETVNEITTIGLDLAKHTFHVVGCTRHGKAMVRKMLRRGQVRTYFANLPACVVGMEACASAHYWARELRGLGHEVRLIPAQHVKAYVRGNKNDYNDARAIAEAASRADMRLVAVKSVEQQDVQALHRMRQARVGERTALCNQVRGLLAEYGIVLAQGVGTLRRRLPEVLEDAENGLSDFIRPMLARCYEQLCELDTHIEFYTRLVHEHARRDEAVRRLQTVPGFGPVVASVFGAFVGDGREFRRGRDVSAALGLVPKQHGTGGKTDNSAAIRQKLAEKLPEWEALDIVPSEKIPDGNKTTEPQRYGMSRWRISSRPGSSCATVPARKFSGRCSTRTALQANWTMFGRRPTDTWRFRWTQC